MKKILSFVLMAMLLVSLGAVATAQERPTYTVKVNVQPLEVVRSDGTEDLWMKEVEVEFPKKDLFIAKDVHDIELGEVAQGGMLIEVEAEHAESMWMLMGGNWMDMLKEGQTHHFAVKLMVDPALESQEVRVHRGTEKVSTAKVTVTVKDSTGAVVVTPRELHPMHSKGGFHYGGNLGLPQAGDYMVSLAIQPPAFTRSNKQKDRWLSPITQEFSYQWDGNELEDEIEIGEVEVADNLKIELEAEHPEEMLMLMGGNWMEMKPASTDTHHFEVKLEDTTITGDLHVKLHGAKVRLTVINDQTGEQQDFGLHEMYGGSGYHYATNATLK